MSDANSAAIVTALNGWKLRAGVWLKLAVAIGLGSGLLLIVQARLLAGIVDAVLFDQAVLSQVLPWLLMLLPLFLVRAALAW
ncbi:MAG: thiol reductant ABC exporter subunit CydD, partial [Gammaproteobacteria bacterium]